MRQIALAVILPCLLGLGACAMQRAVDAQTAQKALVGKNREEIFACMGIPKKKASEGATEIWAYESGNKRVSKNKERLTTSKDFADAFAASLGFEDEVRTARFCTVQIVMKDGIVQAVNYNGPTGGFMTEDEQCAYAVRNCLNP